jgi:hypothetical protein
MKPPHFGSQAMTAANRSTKTAAEHMAVPMATFIDGSGELLARTIKSRSLRRTHHAGLSWTIGNPLICAIYPQEIA